MKRLREIFGSRELDDWRDREILRAAKILDQIAADVLRALDPEFRAATWTQGLIAPHTFLADKVTPRLRAVTGPAVAMLVEGANESLAQLVRHQAVWTRRPEAPLAAAGMEGAGDLALAAAPLAAGTAIAAALPAVAVTTSAGLLGTGLFATTVISWPVVAVGGAAVGVAFATGALSASRIRGNAEARLRRRAAAHVEATLIRGTKDHPAILEQLTTLFTEAAAEAKRRR